MTTPYHHEDNNIEASSTVLATEPAPNITTFNGSVSAKVTDFTNYFCTYTQLYYQKQMLPDHNHMAD